MATQSGNQTFSSIAGGITDVVAQTQAPTLADAPASAPAETATPAPGAQDSSPPAKRPVGRPKGSKNKTTHITLDFNPPEKRPVGRPRGSGKKKADADAAQAKRPVGRPRKDGLPSGISSKTTLSTLVPPMNDYYRMTNNNAPINQWVPAFPGSISAPPLGAGVLDPALESNEWAELARSNPDDFMHVLLAALDAPNAASLIGPSVEEAFRSHLGSLAPPPSASGSSSANGSTSAPTQTIPSLYSILKTFWLPSSPSYFALTASATSARTPSPHRFLYWDPQPLVFNGIACPTCTAPLMNRGRIRSGPLTVHDLAGPFFIIGCTYACANNHAYASTDAAVRCALPAALEREFPARLIAGDAGVEADVWNWQARGVSRALWNLVLGALRAGLARDVILQLVRDVQHGVPEMVAGVKQEEQMGSAMEEEESAEEGAGPEDVAMPPSDGATEPTAASAAQAFNDAWTANSVIASTGDLTHNPYARLALPMFPQAISMIPYDPGQRKRPYPFAESDGGAGSSGTMASNGVSAGAPSAIAGNGAGVDGAEASGSGSASPSKPRNPRHCCKCGSQTCKGKGGRNFCTSACMDCGKFDCRGRNSRRPDKRCDAGWPEGQPQPQVMQAPQGMQTPQGMQAPQGVQGRQGPDGVLLP
ncbi:hypothetical protein C8R44DRAFT_879967 [Mycena epipterygia]|nr:hypothetical protein C8R44DRAFT_879967 [Mycena epipterygia]